MRVTRRLHLLLAPHGLAYLVPRIHEAYGDGAHRVVSERPYELTSVFGVGLRDRRPDRPGRRASRVTAPTARGQPSLHVLAEAERSGSTCLPLRVVALESLADLLGSASSPRL